MKLDPRRIFQHATSYHHAANKLLWSAMEEKQGGRDIVHPQMMMSAFTSELYLRAAYAIERNGEHAGNRHELNVLFSRLSQHFRDSVTQAWHEVEVSIRNQFPGRDFSLQNSLKVGRAAFEDYRYSYEKQTKDFMLSDLPDVLRKVMVGHYPLFAGEAPILEYPHLEGPGFRAKRLVYLH